MNLRRDVLHLLTGAYAADALTGAELAEFERHLHQCPSCAEEVRGLRETAARFGMATAIASPPGMRRQVLAAASRTRQLPPAGRKLAALSAPRPDRRPRPLPRPVIAAAGTAAAAAIVALAVLQANTQHQLDQAQARNRAIAAVLAAPDASVESSRTTVGGTVTAVISARDGEAVVTAARLPALPGAMVYQLWVIGAADARSAGLLPLSSTGVSSPVLAGDLRPGDHLGITIEPAGGTAKPTTTPVVLVTAEA